MAGTTTNQKLLDWVAEWAEILQPADIHWCDGGHEEPDVLERARHRLIVGAVITPPLACDTR